jgi:hypothetical protein
MPARRKHAGIFILLSNSASISSPHIAALQSSITPYCPARVRCGRLPQAHDSTATQPIDGKDKKW